MRRYPSFSLPLSSLSPLPPSSFHQISILPLSTARIISALRNCQIWCHRAKIMYERVSCENWFRVRKSRSQREWVSMQLAHCRVSCITGKEWQRKAKVATFPFLQLCASFCFRLTVSKKEKSQESLRTAFAIAIVWIKQTKLSQPIKSRKPASSIRFLFLLHLYIYIFL